MGIPNRNGSESFKGEEFAEPSISLQYATQFPDDVNYVIGKSDFRKDWSFQHVPRNEDPRARPVPYGGIRGNGRATPYTIHFDLNTQPHGRATLRLAFCATGARAIEVDVNGKSAGQVDRLLVDGGIARHSGQGLWYERELAFDASLLKQGANALKLIVPAGPINNGVIYDYLRLELDDPSTPSASSATEPPHLFVAGDSTASAGASDRGNCQRLAVLNGLRHGLYRQSTWS